VKIEELLPGTGAVALRRTRVAVRYTLSLNRGECVQHEEQATFIVGARSVVADLEYGVEGMRVGGRRRIHVPPHLAYGSQAVAGIPANAKLVFEVELLSAYPPTAG
jgi:FKBP-type peptidyl-prolyl cis-trans isomerase